ncbi:hypothetical protein LCGC14_1393000 [marine sediment metagenome]|uniref:Uncharacterized protein n=1 Tax=marine sediment metagenome TaxID=412755 RepID=A0A0F9MEW5_9ZZZZ
MYHNKRLITLLFILLISVFCLAANKIYIAPETAVVWTAGGGDELLDMGGQAAAEVRTGSFLDLGAASRSSDYVFTFFIDQFATAPVLGETIDLYFGMGTSTTSFDGEPNTAPGDSAEGNTQLEQLKNLLYVGSAVVGTTTAADATLRITGFVRFFQRYIFPVVHNNTADALNSTGDGHSITLTPVPAEIQ